MVKLGTITPSGADVFSYHPDENDMVTDAKLVRSLLAYLAPACRLYKASLLVPSMQVAVDPALSS